MHDLGIKTGKELSAFSLLYLQQHFGKSGLHYYNIARGIDNRPVNRHRDTKSVGVEVTFDQDITGKAEAITQLQGLLIKAIGRASEKQLSARTLTVKIKYHDFVQITRSRTLPMSVTDAAGMAFILEDLLKNTDIGRRPARLLGVTLSSLATGSAAGFQQLDLFTDY
ncbi:MAG: hypothetical protein Q8Q40_07760 [Methylococcaceae bacterium]|nr:hypothetical protein [Methylococcaceae bacterium]